MRISTANTYDVSVSTLSKRARELSETQGQISSMKRVNRASDDPAAAARAERAIAAKSRIEADQRAVDASLNRMTMAESTLGSATDLLQQAHELMVGAGNASYSDAERAALGTQLQGIRDQLLTLANRDDGAGNFLFGGQGSSAPFADTTSGVQYQGHQGQTRAADSDGMPLALDGEATWLQANSGNGSFVTAATTVTGDARIDAGQVVDPSAVTGASYSIVFGTAADGSTTYSVLQGGAPTAQANVPYVSGKAISFDGLSVAVTGTPAAGDTFDITPSANDLNVFDVLDRTVSELKTPNRSPSQVTQSNTFAMRDIGQSLERLQTARSQAGIAMNRLEAATGRNQDLSLTQESVRSQAEDLDLVKAVSEFQTRQTGYDAALKAYSMVQQLSLFNYVKF